MKFSVVIPVYNVEQYLKDCLDSVLHQTFVDWEAICVNDGSTDQSLTILEEYASQDGRFKIINQSNGGLSSARNSGLKAVGGEYVVFLDSDDWLEENALEIMSKKLNGEDLLCFSGRRFLEEEDMYRDPDVLLERSYLSGMDYYNENALWPRDFAFVCVVLRAYKRTFLTQTGLWFKEGILHEDNLFTPQICYYAKRVKQIGDCLYDYRVRASSITTTVNKKRLGDLMQTANELAAFFINKLGFDKKVVYRAITHHYQIVFVNASKDDVKEFKKLCDWNLYRKVSRTKLRHRMNYWKNKLRN